MSSVRDTERLALVVQHRIGAAEGEIMRLLHERRVLDQVISEAHERRIGAQKEIEVLGAQIVGLHEQLSKLRRQLEAVAGLR